MSEERGHSASYWEPPDTREADLPCRCEMGEIRDAILRGIRRGMADAGVRLDWRVDCDLAEQAWKITEACEYGPRCGLCQKDWDDEHRGRE